MDNSGKAAVEFSSTILRPFCCAVHNSFLLGNKWVNCPEVIVDDFYCALHNKNLVQAGSQPPVNIEKYINSAVWTNSNLIYLVLIL